MTAAKTMPLPPPCGAMTVTYEIDRKVRIPVFNESALRSFAEEAQKKDAETIKLLVCALNRIINADDNQALTQRDIELGRIAIAKATGDQE